MKKVKLNPLHILLITVAIILTVAGGVVVFTDNTEPSLSPKSYQQSIGIGVSDVCAKNCVPPFIGAPPIINTFDKCYNTWMGYHARIPYCSFDGNLGGNFDPGDFVEDFDIGVCNYVLSSTAEQENFNGPIVPGNTFCRYVDCECGGFAQPL